MLELDDVHVLFHSGSWPSRREHAALDGVSMQLRPGEILGVMGESGCGKTTMARVLCLLQHPTMGRVMLDGQDVSHSRGDDLQRFRRRVQIVFQHPESALNPRRNMEWSLREGIRASGIDPSAFPERREELIEALSIPEQIMSRFPHQVSGGEVQRIALARALAIRPDFLVLDEPTSMLDVSVQAHIMSTLLSYSRQAGTAILLVSHDRELVETFCHRILRMKEGRFYDAADRIGEVT
jgi:peptide/nickel transport system ATP-binding protein